MLLVINVFLVAWGIRKCDFGLFLVLLSNSFKSYITGMRHEAQKTFPPPARPAQKMLRFHTSRSSAFYDVVRVTFTSPRPHPRRPPQGVFKSPTCLQKPSAKVAPGPELLSLTCLDSISMSFLPFSCISCQI